MTARELLHTLKKFCEDSVKGMVLPTAVQRGDTEEHKRVPTMYEMRLPDSGNAEKLAPYEIIQVVHTKHIQNPGDKPRYFVDVRLVFCVYCEDEQDGAIMLLNFMERVQMRLLKEVDIGSLCLLDVNEPLEMLIYPEDTAPYYAGEMSGTFVLPGTEREVDLNGLKSQIGKRI